MICYFTVVHKPELHAFNKRNMTLSEKHYCCYTEVNNSSPASCGYFGIPANLMHLNNKWDVQESYYNNIQCSLIWNTRIECP